MAEKQPFGAQAAQFSLFAPLVMILVNMLCTIYPMQRTIGAVIGLSAFVVYGVALVLGIVALFSMRKLGRKGILVRATIGVVLNASLLVLAVVLVVATARGEHPPILPLDRQASITPFRFTPPSGFAVFPPGMNLRAGILQSFIKGDPADNVPDIVLLVEDLGGTIGREDMSAFARGKENIRLFRENWKTCQIDVFEVREKIGEVDTLTYNAQVPLWPTAVQLTVVGLASRESELRDIVREALKGVDGTSNW
jgi:hypothetical protein